MKTKYPEHQKLNCPSREHLMMFAEWLDENDYQITHWSEKRGEQPVEVVVKPENVVYRYFNVDPRILEDERRQMLKAYK